jgi:glutamate formiminotransferase
MQLKDEKWKPDYGTAKFVPSWGASIVGARDFLIAYNVNVMATKEQAHRIALNIRTNGRGPTQVRNVQCSTVKDIKTIFCMSTMSTKQFLDIPHGRIIILFSVVTTL